MSIRLPVHPLLILLSFFRPYAFSVVFGTTRYLASNGGILCHPGFKGKRDCLQPGDGYRLDAGKGTKRTFFKVTGCFQSI